MEKLARPGGCASFCSVGQGAEPDLQNTVLAFNQGQGEDQILFISCWVAVDDGPGFTLGELGVDFGTDFVDVVFRSDHFFEALESLVDFLDNLFQSQNTPPWWKKEEN